jgi:hypothetical protein
MCECMYVLTMLNDLMNNLLVIMRVLKHMKWVNVCMY